jgi:hypothetical protein
LSVPFERNTSYLSHCLGRSAAMPTAPLIKTLVFAMSLTISPIDADENLSCFPLQANNPTRTTKINIAANRAKGKLFDT